MIGYAFSAVMQKLRFTGAISAFLCLLLTPMTTDVLHRGSVETAKATGIATAPAVSVVPKPRQLHATDGFYQWPRQLRIAFVPGAGRRAAEALANFARSQRIAVAFGDPSQAHEVVLAVNKSIDLALGNEGYTAAVTLAAFRYLQTPALDYFTASKHCFN